MTRNTKKLGKNLLQRAHEQRKQENQNNSNNNNLNGNGNNVNNENDNAEDSQNGFISIIIPCFNERANIASTLLFIEKHARDRNNMEIVCVDGGSTDNWPAQVEHLQSQNLLTITTCILNSAGRSGRGICLNIGVEQAKGDMKNTLSRSQANKKQLTFVCVLCCQ